MKVAVLLGKPYARPDAYIKEARSIPSLTATTHARKHHVTKGDAIFNLVYWPRPFRNEYIIIQTLKE